MTKKEAFGRKYGGTTFLALVQIKSTYGHNRYRLRWYTVTKNGSCVPGSVEDFGVKILRRIGTRFSLEMLYSQTKGFYTVGRPSWRTVDWAMLDVCKQLRLTTEDSRRYVYHVMCTDALRVYGIEHDRHHDPFRKIWPSL